MYYKSPNYDIKFKCINNFIKIQLFQFNWIIRINMTFTETNKEESLLARTSREFWCAELGVFWTLRIGLYYTYNDEITESSTLVPTCMEEV